MSKRWKLGEKEYIVEELEISQDQEIMKLLRACGVTDLSNLNADTILYALGEKELLQKFFALVLVPVNGAFDKAAVPELETHTAKMKNTTALEVAEDFFGRNKSFFNKLEGYFQKLMKTIQGKVAEVEKQMSRVRPTSTAASSSNSPTAISA